MMARTSRRSFLQASAVGLMGVAGWRQLQSVVYAAPAEEKWIPLFDGKSLEGWHKNPKKIGHGTGGQWVVEDGAISGQQDPPGSGNGGILLTDRKFGDFELLIDMKPDWGVCSGLFLRGNDVGQCLQMMVDYHDQGNIGHLYGEGVGGFSTRTFDIDGRYDDEKKLVGIKTSNHKSVEEAGLKSSCQPDEWVAAWKVDDWNTARVRVTGKYPQITTWINDQKICEFDGEKSANSGYQTEKENILQKLGTQGSIAVQVHGGTGWPKGAKCRWKEIKIREL